MVVEFIGAPGAGKTTLLPVVIASLRERGIHGYTAVEAARPFVTRTLAGRVVNRLTPRALQRPVLWRLFLIFSLLYRLRFLMHHPRLVWLVWRSQWGRPAGADVRARRVLHWFFRFVGDYAFLRAQMRPDEALVVDEGFVHRVVQLFASAAEVPDPDWVARYLHLIPQPDLVVYVCASAPLCEQRIYARGLWQRFAGKDPAEIARFVVNAHATVQLAVAQIQRADWQMVAIDNSGAPPHAPILAHAA